MASPFSLSGKKKDSGGYNALLKKNMARYKDRDEAVRKTNIVSGYGNSTAQRHMHDGGGRAAPGKTAPGKTAPAGKAAPAGADRRKTSSTKRKGNFSLPKSAPIPAQRPTRSPTSEPNSLTPSPPPGIGSGIPTPPQPSFSPDMAVSPPRPPDPMSAGAPHGMGMSGIGFVPPPQGFTTYGQPPGSPTSVPNSPPPMPQMPPPPTSPRWGAQQPPLFNDYGFKSEPQDPNEPWWKALFRG